jgi:hypothetical protein
MNTPAVVAEVEKGGLADEPSSKRARLESVIPAPATPAAAAPPKQEQTTPPAPLKPVAIPLLAVWSAVSSPGRQRS